MPLVPANCSANTKPGTLLDRREAAWPTNRFAEAALEHGPAPSASDDVHRTAREPGPQPVEHRSGGADEPAFRIEIPVGKLEAAQ